jgi:hypothetical protein
LSSQSESQFLFTSCTTNEKLSFTDGSYSATFCGEWTTKLAIETCSNELNITLTTLSQADSLASRGIAIYYEEVDKPVGLSCPVAMTTMSTPSAAAKVCIFVVVPGGLYKENL